jgi:hypothetical protein
MDAERLDDSALGLRVHGFLVACGCQLPDGVPYLRCFGPSRARRSTIISSVRESPSR